MIFGGPALPGLFDPRFIASSFGLAATNLVGDNELRAVYGGLLSGIALFFALAVFRAAWHPVALGAQVCIFGGMVIARAVSIAVSGNPGANVHFMLASEVFGAAVALFALRSITTSSAAVPQ